MMITQISNQLVSQQHSISGLDAEVMGYLEMIYNEHKELDNEHKELDSQLSHKLILLNTYVALKIYIQHYFRGEGSGEGEKLLNLKTAFEAALSSNCTDAEAIEQAAKLVNSVRSHGNLSSFKTAEVLHSEFKAAYNPQNVLSRSSQTVLDKTKPKDFDTTIRWIFNHLAPEFFPILELDVKSNDGHDIKVKDATAVLDAPQHGKKGSLASPY